MKIALLHYDLSRGPQERNTAFLCAGIEKAARAGADWIVTPEMALQGYFFAKTGKYQWGDDWEKAVRPILTLAKKYRAVIFLGCGERDGASGKKYNACFVIDERGELIGKHRKIRIVGADTEGWASAGKAPTLLKLGGVSAGLLICADAWHEEHGAFLGDRGAELIIVIAAWPPGCCGSPEAAWERCAKASGNRPMLVCNQTGDAHGLCFDMAKSAALQGGRVRFSYQGGAAVLLADYDEKKKGFEGTEFCVL